MSVRIAKLQMRSRIVNFPIGPAYYLEETKKHREIIKEQKIASSLNRANLSKEKEDSLNGTNKR